MQNEELKQQKNFRRLESVKQSGSTSAFTSSYINTERLVNEKGFARAYKWFKAPVDYYFSSKKKIPNT